MRVECYAGHRGDERPVAFWLDAERIAIEAVLDAWTTENGTFFRVRGSDRRVSVLRRDDSHDCWHLISFTFAHEQDTP